MFKIVVYLTSATKTGGWFQFSRDEASGGSYIYSSCIIPHGSVEDGCTFLEKTIIDPIRYLFRVTSQVSQTLHRWFRNEHCHAMEDGSRL